MPTGFLDFERFHYHKAAATSVFIDPNVPEHFPPDLELEPTHLDIDLQVDIKTETARGRVTTTVTARRQGPTRLVLDAVAFEDVAVRDADDHALTWRYDGEKIYVNWNREFAAAEQRRLEISYRVTHPVAGLYFCQPDEAYPDNPWYAASDHETERARHWLPCIDHLNVRTTLTFHLRAEDRFTILANGLLVAEENHGDGTKTAHWQLDQRCPSYLVCFVIGDLVKADDGSFHDGEKEIPLAYFASRYHTADDLMRAFGRTRNMMAWMTKKLDMPFPYPKYYQFALPGIGGAMENISLVSWSDFFVLDEVAAAEMAWFVDQVNVHEMAHSYFGDAIVCRDFAHVWLKESWATYIEQVWREDSSSKEEGDYVYYDHAIAYFQEADEEYLRPIVTRRFKSSWEMFDRHLYPGGACRLHTLRCELGDETFWKGVQDYLKRYNGKVVETDDFRRVFEEHSGRSLVGFFNQWFYSPGYPDLKVEFEYDEKQKQGTFTIEQKQVDKEKNIPAFTLNTDLSWTINGEEQRRPIKLTEAKHTFIYAMLEEPEQVRFDPGMKVLHKLAFNPGKTMLRRQLTEAKDVIGRILAAHELCKTGQQANIEAVVEAYFNEPFWGVRREMARALGNAGHEAAIAGLARIIAWEQDGNCLRHVFIAAKNYRDSRLRDAIAGRLRGELPHLARQQAYEAMGLQRGMADHELLMAGAEQVSYNGLAQSGAFVGLAHTRRDEVVDYLLNRATYGATSNRARPAVMRALGHIGKNQEKAAKERIVETLVDRLRDPWENVRFAAAYTLPALKEPTSLEPLTRFSEQVSHQDRVGLQDAINALRQADKSDGSAVKKQVEDLEEKVRKLQDQLQKVAAKVAVNEE